MPIDEKKFIKKTDPNTITIRRCTLQLSLIIREPNREERGFV